MKLRSHLMLAALMAVSITSWAGEKKDVCSGHGVTRKYRLKPGTEGIDVKVKIGGTLVLPTKPGDTPPSVGSFLVDEKIVVAITASDNDYHVCDAQRAVPAFILSKFKGSALSTLVFDWTNKPWQELKVSDVIKLVKFPAPPKKAYFQKWTDEWKIPKKAAGKRILIRLFGEIDDVPCDEPKHASDDEKIDLHKKQIYVAQLFVATLLHVKLAKGPEYAPIGSNVGGSSFAVEKGDSITLKAIPFPSDLSPSKVTWSGDGVSGTGVQKTIKYTSTGTKSVTVAVGPITQTVKIYVNDNASSPILAAKIIWDKKWAHCGGDETIILKATGIDHDWYQGGETVKDWIALDRTSWAVPEGLGEVSNLIGRKTEWTPPANPTGGIPIVATISDSASDYSPADDTNVIVTETFGCFKVKVTSQVTLSGDLTGPPDAKKPANSWLDEDGKSGGHVNSNHDAWIPKAVMDASDVAAGEWGEDEKNVKVTVRWTFKTIPAEAQPAGRLKADLAVEGSARFTTRVKDSDLFDDPFKLSISASWVIGAAIDWHIKTSDNNEGSGACAVHFMSDANFSVNRPASLKNQLQDTSRNYDESDLPAAKQKLWIKKKETLREVSRENGETIQAVLVLGCYARAGKGKLAKGATFGQAHILHNVFSKGFANVGYEPAK